MYQVWLKKQTHIMFNVIYVLYVPLQKYYKNNLHTNSKLVSLFTSIFPPFKKKSKEVVYHPGKTFEIMQKQRNYIFYGMIINKNGSFRYIFGSNKRCKQTTNYLISMKHIGYYWYTKLMKSPCPRNIFCFYFFKRKKIDNPKVQISSKSETTFSIHPVSWPNSFHVKS